MQSGYYLPYRHVQLTSPSSLSTMLNFIVTVTYPFYKAGSGSTMNQIWVRHPMLVESDSDGVYMGTVKYNFTGTNN